MPATTTKPVKIAPFRAVKAAAVRNYRETGHPYVVARRRGVRFIETLEWAFGEEAKDCYVEAVIGTAALKVDALN